MDPNIAARLIVDLIARARSSSESTPGVSTTAFTEAISVKDKIENQRYKFLRQYIRLKRKWSDSLLTALWVTVVFQIGFAAAVLILGAFHRKVDTSYAIVVSGGTFAELFGLCYLVVKHLFPSKEEIEELSKSKFKEAQKAEEHEPESGEARKRKNTDKDNAAQTGSGSEADDTDKEAQTDDDTEVEKESEAEDDTEDT